MILNLLSMTMIRKPLQLYITLKNSKIICRITIFIKYQNDFDEFIIGLNELSEFINKVIQVLIIILLFV